MPIRIGLFICEKMKRSAFLSVTVLASLMISMYACSSAPAETSSPVPAAENAAVAETEDAGGSEVKNWGGRAFNIISRGSDYGSWESFDVYTGEINGEPLNDSVYERNAAIMEKYGIEIVETKMGTLEEKIRNLVMAGDASYDAAVTSGVDASNLSTGCYLRNLNSLPTLDLTNTWWDQNAVHDFKFGEKLFMGVSDFLISDKDGSWVYVFNKRLADDLGVEYPYQAARDGTWTFDKMHSVASVAVADLDGDGAMKPKKDRFGVATENYDTYAAFFYSGARIFDIGDDGYPQYVLFSEYNETAYSKYLDLFVRDSTIYFHGESDTERVAFKDGRALFKGFTLLGVRNDFRDLEDDFGIIVAPKYDEAQKSYAHIVSIGTSGSVICVPLIIPDPEFTGSALDAVSRESTDTLLETYITKCFNGKYLRDEESCEMLELCFATRVYDISVIYTQWGLLSKFYGLKPKADFSIASLNASVEESIQSNLEETIEIYKSMEE